MGVNPSSFPFLQGMKDFFLFFFSHPPVKDTKKKGFGAKNKVQVVKKQRRSNRGY